MNDRILCVDDDASVLAAYQRILRKEYTVDVANGGEEALRLIGAQGPYAVILSDMRMPRMDGIRLLTQVKDEHPLSVRIMLTGDGDQGTAIQAVNEGRIFRFLTKPCPPDVLGKALAAGVRQYRLQTAERELLDRTLGGCVRMLTELLSLSDPETFARARNLRDRIHLVAKHMGQGDAWEIETAALLAPIGAATIPPVVLLKSRLGRALSEAEGEMVSRVPRVGYKLLASIPRLEGVALIVLHQNRDFAGSGSPPEEASGAAIPIGARILRVLSDLSRMESDGLAVDQAIAKLASQAGRYDPAVLAAVGACLPGYMKIRELVVQQRRVGVRDLRIGQVLRSDVRTVDGKLLLSAGHTISEALLERLENTARIDGVAEPITVEDAFPRGGAVEGATAAVPGP